MAIIPSIPDLLQNGTTADATQIMANFNAIMSDVNANAAANGVNSDITNLTALTQATAATAFVVSNTTASNRAYYAETSGSTRWAWGADTAAESGSNAGSNWFLEAFDDAGTFIDEPIYIDRVAGGLISFSRPIAFNGGLQLPSGTIAATQAPGDNSTHVATTAYVDGTFAPLASPTFTGTPVAPTPSPGDNSTKLATTAFLLAAFTAGQTLAATGSQTFPGGLILKWGSVATNGSGVGSVSYATAFPNAVFRTFATLASSGLSAITVSSSVGAKTGFTVYACDPTITGVSVSAQWFAIGN